jgi:DNA-directed RNA polymerase specialized sigma24 family protein
VTKEQLRAYRNIRLERDRLKKMIAELESDLYSPRGPSLDGMPRGGGVDKPDRTDVLLDRKDEVIRAYKAKEAELSEAILAIEAAIETLPSVQRTIVRLYYIEALTWEEVCVEAHYSWSQTHRHHKAALRALREVGK